MSCWFLGVRLFAEGLCVQTLQSQTFHLHPRVQQTLSTHCPKSCLEDDRKKGLAVPTHSHAPENV